MLRFIVLAFCFSSFTVPSFATTCDEHHCIAIVDAGSTGSRLHIYSYDEDETSSPVNIKEVWSKKIKPGFATLEPNSQAINTHMDNLVAEAPTQNIPVYFYATAGMRLLPSSKQKLYYNELQHWFEQHTEWQLAVAKTITGTDEALFDWLSVNYHLGTLNSPIQNKTIGVMDMGGASVQIVFPLTETDTLNNKSVVDVTIYGRKIRLFAHSFLGLGQTEMSHQFLNSTSCFANNYPLPDGDSGQGDALHCKQEIASLMNSVHGIHQFIQPLLESNSIDSWYGIGGISNLADNTLFHFENNTLTNESLLSQADSALCHEQWDALEAQFPNDDYLYQYCLLSSYYYALMVDGYGLKPHQNVHYLSSTQGIDWTIGAVLHH